MQSRKSRTARRYASRVLRFRICAAKNSRKRFSASPPARTINAGIPDTPPARSSESGEYASSSEVMREALREWTRRRAMESEEVEALRRLWHEGLESGPGRLADMAAIKAEARRRFVEAQNI
jgi:antitoxin ParD1/3/4